MKSVKIILHAARCTLHAARCTQIFAKIEIIMPRPASGGLFCRRVGCVAPRRTRFWVVAGSCAEK